MVDVESETFAHSFVIYVVHDLSGVVVVGLTVCLSVFGVKSGAGKEWTVRAEIGVVSGSSKCKYGRVHTGLDTASDGLISANSEDGG